MLLSPFALLFTAICASFAFLNADVFQFLDTVLWEILNVVTDHSSRCIKNRVYNNFNLRYFVSSIIESLHNSFLT